MKDYLSVIEYGGKKILYANHQECSEDEITEHVKQSEEIVIKMKNTGLLMLIDLRNCDLSESTVNQLRETAKKIKDFVFRTAILGVTGVRKLVLISINKESGIGAKAFENEDEAKKWLIS